jgi:hypothetical protein
MNTGRAATLSLTLTLITGAAALPALAQDRDQCLNRCTLDQTLCGEHCSSNNIPAC